MFGCTTAHLSLPLSSALLLCCLFGCARAPQPTTTTSAQAQCAAAPGPAASPEARPYELTFVMRMREAGGFDSLPEELQTFTLGPWECALGPLTRRDELSALDAQLVRERRLACTHKTGATVQSELRCEMPAAVATARAASYRREFALTLSGASDLVIACQPEPIERLGAGRPGPAVVTCPSPDAPCPQAAAPESSSVTRE